MSFDFKSSASTAHTQTATLLSAIVLGPSGAGKSFLCGTLPGRTLYLYTSGEDHGVHNALSAGGNVHPVCLDHDDDTVLAADASFKRLLEILGSTEALKKEGFKSIVIDSATELEAIIRNTKEWEDACTTKNGKHDGFAETGATLNMLRKVAVILKAAQRSLGCHTVITCGLDVKALGEDGEIEEASPRLTGYSVAEGLIQMCGDVLVVGRMSKDGVSKHKLQFMTAVEKVSKDAAGRVKKAINFNPRIAGLKVSELPAFIDADLSKVVELKKGKKK